jgi:hypothetical protein
MTASSGDGPRILLGHLVSNGDCLFATTVARQIKADFPGCHLTWAIGSTCRAILAGNPDVDEVWEIALPGSPPRDFLEHWALFRAAAAARIARGEFDRAFYTQIVPDNEQLYDGMIRSTTLRGYRRPITVPLTPVLRLSSQEVERVRRYAEERGLPGCPRVVLFEFAPRSGQSDVTPELALELAREMVTQTPDARVILSSNLPVASGHPRIFDASGLSLRENAALTHYCTLLVGCSSGITWISTSEAAKPLPLVQLLKQDALWFNSVRRDFQHWGWPVDTIIEIEDGHAGRVPDCVRAIFSEGFATARTRFHEDIPANFRAYARMLCDFLRHGEWQKAWTLLRVNLAEHGFQRALLNFRLRWIARGMFRPLRRAAPPSA